MQSHSDIETRTVAAAWRWPWHGWLGLALILVFWILNWTLSGLRTQWGFFPLWLGFCLTVDALVVVRKGSSLLTRQPRAYLVLFVLSVPIWWLFEVLNWRSQNWHYEGREYFSNLEFFLLSSLSFSTVIPAVFGAAELAGSYSWLRRFARGPRPAANTRNSWGMFIAGWLMLGLLLAWPRYFFPFLWLAPYFIIEPVNYWRGNRTLLEDLVRGDWRPVLALWGGVALCAFFWEMWNYYSYPKWIYHVPFVGFLHIFEMPLLGYGGYLPFSMALFALYHFMIGFFLPREQQTYLELTPAPGSNMAATR